MKRFYPLIAIILVFSLVFSTTAFAVDAPAPADEADQAPILWIHDESNFEGLFGTDRVSVQSGTVRTNTVAQSLTLSETKNTTSLNATYTFDMDGAGGAAPITVSGVMETYDYDDSFSVHMGTLKGTATLDGVLCEVRAVVQKKAGGDAMNAGITIIPETAEGLSDYLYFAIGEEVITVDMLPDWMFEDSTDDMTTTQMEDSVTETTQELDFTYLTGSYGTFSGPGASGTSHRVQFHYNYNIRRALVSTDSFVSNVENGFTAAGGFASTIVQRLKIGLRTTPETVPTIQNIHSATIDGDESTNYIGECTISFLVSILSDVFDLLNVQTSAFGILLGELADSDAMDVAIHPIGANSYIEYNYSTNPFYMKDVNFDDAPMPVTFNLSSSIPATADFWAYSEIEYYTIYTAPGATSPVYFSTEGGDATTVHVPLYIG